MSVDCMPSATGTITNRYTGDLKMHYNNFTMQTAS